MWKKMLKAARFCRTKHLGQTRADGSPYYRHPMAVAKILWNNGFKDLDLITAAYLHDIIEDTNVTRFELIELFGEEVGRLVMSVTKSNSESKLDYYKRIKESGVNSIALKMADREHNNSDLANAPESNTLLREKAAIKTTMMYTIFSEQTDVSEEFNKLFKKCFWDILA